MLADRYEAKINEILLPRDSFKPYPTVEDRTPWQSLPEKLRQAQVSLAETHLGFDWPALPATLFLEFSRNGNRRNFERASFAWRNALESLVTGECIADDGRYLDDITNGIWSICEESFWGIPAHNYATGRKKAPLPDTSEPIIDLFAAETGGLLAWTHYLLKPRLDAITELISERIVRETKRRIIDPFLERDDFWWMGLEGGRRVNNWNPWCTSNCLTALLLLEDDEDRRRRGVAKSLRILDVFLASYSPDGGCDEGTSYWNRAGASLFDCLDLLALATGGAIDVFGEPLVGEIGRYMVRMYIGGDFFVNFADGSAKLGAGQAASLLYRYGERIGDRRLRALGVARHRKHERASLEARGSLLRKLPALFGFEDLDRAEGEAPFLRDAWLEHTQVMTAREKEGTDRGLYLAAKGGHNGESHNHNDVGNFIVYADGRPVVIDAGVGTYTKKTFSSERYEIWTMRSPYHNLPTVGGVEQRAGSRFCASDVAYASDSERAQLSLDLARAFPKEAGIEHWRRTIALLRGSEPAVLVVDEFSLSSTREVVWSIMTPREVRMGGNGVILLDDETSTELHFDDELLEAAQERIAIDDERLGGVWGESVYRILFTSVRPLEAERLAFKISRG